MAQVDGEVRIGVGIDTSNIRQDTDKLRKSVESIFSNYTKDSKSANASLVSLQHQMRKYSDALNKARVEQEKLAKTEVYSDRYKQMQADLDKTNKYIEKQSAELTKLKAKEREVGKQQIQTPEYTEAVNKVKSYEAEIDRLDEKYRKIKGTQDQFLARARVPVEFGGLGKTLEEATETKQYKAFDQQLKKIEQQRGAILDLKDSAKATKESLEEVGMAFQSNKDALKLGEASKEYSDIANKIKEVEASLKSASQQAKAYNMTMHSESFRKENVIAGTNTQAYVDATNRVENLKNKLNELVNKYDQVRSSTKNVGPALKNAFSKAKDAIGGVITKLKSLKHESKGTFGDLAKNAKVSFMKILKYAFGIRSIYALFRRLRTTIVNDMKIMGSNFPEIQAQIDSLSASFNQLKLSLGTAFQPIFSVALPALNALMGALVSAMNTLANFFATLTGQKYIYKATKANNALADSYGGAGGAAKDAAEDIAEYDKLIVINQDKAGGGGGGGGAGDTNAGAYEKVPAEQSRLAQLIKEAWSQSDFTDVGTYIGEKLNEGLQNIPWDKIKQTASNLGKDLATLINGFVEVPDLGYNIGKTIAEGFNTGLEFFYSFVENFHWDSVGKFIGDGINGALLNFDWTKLGHTIASGINGAVSTVKNLITTVDVEGIATKIGNGISEFLRTLDTKEIAKTIHLLITKALTGAVALLDSIDFEELGRKLGDFLAGLDIPDLVAKLGKLALKIIEALGKAFYGLVESNPLAASIGALIIGCKLATNVGSGIASSVISSISSALVTSESKTVIGRALEGLFAVHPVITIGVTIAAGFALGDWLYNNVQLVQDWANNVVDTFVWLADEITQTQKEFNKYLEKFFPEQKERRKNPAEVPAFDAWDASNYIRHDNEYNTDMFDPEALKTLGDMKGMTDQDRATILKNNEDITDSYKERLKDVRAEQEQERKLLQYEQNKQKHNTHEYTTYATTQVQKMQEQNTKNFAKGATAGLGLASDLASGVEKEYKNMGGASNAYWHGIMGTAVKGTDLTKNLIDLNKVNTEQTKKSTKAVSLFGTTVTKQGKKTVKSYSDVGDALKSIVSTYKNGSKDSIEANKELQTSTNNLFTESGKEANVFATNTSTAFDKAKTKIGTTVATATTTWSTKWNSAITTTNTNLETSTKTTSNNMLTSIKGVFKDTGLISTVNTLASTITTAMTGSATTSATGFQTSFSTASTKMETSMKTAWSHITKTFNNGKALTDAAGTVQSKFGTVASGIQSAMSGAWKNIVSAFNSNQVSIKVSSTLTTSINGIVDGLRTGINNALSSGFGQVNTLIDKINNMRSFGGVLRSSISHIWVPHLAQGSVIPPNREFLAVLGDQKQGMNIETPLATMLEAFNKALDTRGGSNNAPVVLQLNGRDIARAVWDENEKKYKQVGKYGTKFA